MRLTLILRPFESLPVQDSGAYLMIAVAVSAAWCFREWWNSALRVSSRWLNAVLLGGYPTETISGRAWKEGWWVTVWALDNFWRWMGEQDHCYNSWLIDSRHLDKRPAE